MLLSLHPANEKRVIFEGRNDRGKLKRSKQKKVKIDLAERNKCLPLQPADKDQLTL
jgi:hypothetical protein